MLSPIAERAIEVAKSYTPSFVSLRNLVCAIIEVRGKNDSETGCLHGKIAHIGPRFPVTKQDLGESARSVLLRAGEMAAGHVSSLHILVEILKLEWASVVHEIAGEGFDVRELREKIRQGLIKCGSMKKPLNETPECQSNPCCGNPQNCQAAKPLDTLLPGSERWWREYRHDAREVRAYLTQKFVTDIDFALKHGDTGVRPGIDKDIQSAFDAAMLIACGR